MKKYIIALDGLFGRFLVICEENALGPIIAIYDATDDGHAAALRDLKRLEAA